MYVNHPKILTFQKLSSSVVLFGLKIFHGFVIPGGRIEPAACLVFYLVKKNVRKSLQKKWQSAVKIFTKQQNVPTRTHKKRKIFFHRFSVEYALFTHYISTEYALIYSLSTKKCGLENRF